MSEQADYNTILANERTYAAWLRTGLASLATGLGVERFLGGVISDPVIRAISMSLLLFSIIAFILGAWRYVYVGSLIKSHKSAGAPLPIVLLLSILLVIVGVMAALGVMFI
jgi:putative membrane protein